VRASVICLFSNPTANSLGKLALTSFHVLSVIDPQSIGRWRIENVSRTIANAAEVLTSMSKIDEALFHVAPVFADAHLSDDWDRELSDVFHLLLNKQLQFFDLFRNNIEE
jgi:hypothetical protein